VIARTRARSGFTLIELVTYIALITAASVVIGGLEMAASKAAYLERALVEIAFRSDLLGTRFRSDIREASKINFVPLSPMARGAFLIVLKANGTENRYAIEEADKLGTTTEGDRTTLRAERARLVRELRIAPGRDATLREVTSDVEKLELVRELRGGKAHYVLSITLVSGKGDAATRRSFVFSATPLVEEAP